MKLLIFSAALLVACTINCADSTALPIDTADGLIFCCQDDDEVVTSKTAQRLRNPQGNNGIRISQQKCSEFSARFCQQDEPGDFHIQVVGGTQVRTPGKFPHMAALGWKKSDGSGFLWLCGGSLVNEFYVLTAAHCTYTRSGGLVSERPDTIRLGELDFSIDDTELQDIRIESIIMHPDYKSPSKYHDLALLKLAKRARLTDLIRPVCLWQNEAIEQTVAKAIGWGKTSRIGSGSVKLQEVNLSFFTNKECRESFGETRTMKRGVIPDQLCAGHSEGGRDTCQGDSGGPLTINVPDNLLSNCVHHQVGITSFGIGCGTTRPAIYTRVSHYLDWIEGVVWP